MPDPRRWTWCEDNGVTYLFGLTGTRPLAHKMQETAEAVRTWRAVDDADVVRDFAETRHKATTWSRERRAVARIEATRLGLDIRFVVTNITGVSPRHVYETLYCARGQAENLIKAHKTHLASDRTSCRRAVANQVRLVFYTAAYWLLLRVKDAVPSTCELARAEFGTIRLRLMKIAVRVKQTTSRVRFAFAAGCPEAELFRAASSPPSPRNSSAPRPERRGRTSPAEPRIIPSNASPSPEKHRAACATGKLCLAANTGSDRTLTNRPG